MVLTKYGQKLKAKIDMVLGFSGGSAGGILVFSNSEIWYIWLVLSIISWMNFWHGFDKYFSKELQGKD